MRPGSPSAPPWPQARRYPGAVTGSCDGRQGCSRDRTRECAYGLRVPELLPDVLPMPRFPAGGARTAVGGAGRCAGPGSERGCGARGRSPPSARRKRPRRRLRAGRRPTPLERPKTGAHRPVIVCVLIPSWSRSKAVTGPAAQTAASGRGPARFLKRHRRWVMGRGSRNEQHADRSQPRSRLCASGAGSTRRRTRRPGGHRGRRSSRRSSEG